MFRPGNVSNADTAILATEGDHFPLIAKSRFQPSRNVLEGLLIAMYDLHFYVDNKLRLLSDTVKLRHFLNISADTKAIGRPLEVYVPDDHDKARLKWLIARAEEFKYQENSVPTPPVVRISMLIERSRTDAHILILPEVFESTGQTKAESNRFIVCVNMAEGVDQQRRPATSINTFGARSHNSTCPGDRDTPRQRAPILGRLNELSIRVNSDLSDVDHIQRATRAPRHLLLIQSLTRDLHASTRSAAISPGEAVWINPVMMIHDRFALQDELVRTLSPVAQGRFVEAINRADCKRASSILSDSREGNLDIFNHQTLGATVRSSQLISATFRLFLAVATSTDNPCAALETLHGLAQWAYRIHTKYTITKGVLINTHLSLALATVALKFPSSFSCDATKAWVTGTFASCFSCHQAFKSERDETSPLLYWVCLMWGGILRSFGEFSSAMGALGNLREDIHEYLIRHPKCHSVNQLRLLCIHNLSIRQKDEMSEVNSKPIQPKYKSR